jgi:multidrug efflux system membrane fusion protein
MEKLTKKKLYCGIVTSLFLVGAVLGIMVKGQTKAVTVSEEISLVRTTLVAAGDGTQTYTYSGEVKGRFESQLSFQVGGKIIKRNIQLGSVVTAGDMLMEIDGKDVRQTVNSNSAQVYSAESQLRLAENNLNRYKKLYEGGAISQGQLDQYQGVYDMAVASTRQASAQYAQGTNQLNYSVLYADKSGVVSSITAETGQVVVPGQAIVTIVEEGEREVEINIPENRIDELRTAEEIKVAFWALPTVSVDAVIREIAPMADKVSRTYKVRVSLKKPPQGVKLGMTSTVTVTNKGKKQVATYLPLTAIYQPGDTPGVWVVKNESITLRPIQIGVFGDGKVQVLAGLENGERVVTAGVHKLNEGQKVRLAGDAL